MPDFLSIPGDIRQQYMPFTIAGPGLRQVFSFKDVDTKYPYIQAKAKIHPFSRWVKELIENDSSIQYTHGPKGGSEKVTLEQFLDEIPALQIREYVPDAKLTQTFKWFSYFKKGFDAALQNIDGQSFDFASMKSAIADVMKNIGQTMKDLTSGSAPKLKQVVGGLVSFYQDKGYNIGPDDGFAVLFLPFIMYYRLTTTHTNNVYEIPFSMQNEIMKSDGTYGWTSTQSDFGILDAAAKKIGENPISKLLLGNTVKVNMMPSFQPTGDAKGESFTINIDLINDTDEAAINNFLMCHTLFGNNRWLQYGFVQAGASLYDVKLPGANRYFMCAGQFSCKGKGAFRTPSDEVCDAIVSHNKPKRTFVKEWQSGKLRNQMILDIADNIKQEFLSEERENNSPEENDFPELFEEAQQRTAISDYSVLTKQIDMKVQSDITTRCVSNQCGIVTVNNEFIAVNDGRIDSAITRDANTYAKIKEYGQLNQYIANRQKEFSAVYGDWVKETGKINVEIQRVSNASVEEMNAELSEKLQPYLDKWNSAKAEYDANPQDTALRDKALAAEQAYSDEKTRLGENGEGYRNKTLISLNEEKTTIQNNYETVINEIQTDYTNATDQLDDVKEYLSDEAVIRANAQVEELDKQFSVKAATVTREDIRKLIKIPDVYSLTLTFNSLLPDNFNNYLYGFRANNLDPIENYAAGTVSELGVFEKLVQQLEAAIKGGG